jgi:hypothetical protein
MHVYYTCFLFGFWFWVRLLSISGAINPHCLVQLGVLISYISHCTESLLLGGAVFLGFGSAVSGECFFFFF